MTYYKLQIQSTPSGEGLFTLENIPANSTVIEYEGIRQPKDSHTDHKYCFEYDSQVHIVGDCLARLIRDPIPNKTDTDSKIVNPNLRFKYYHPAKKVFLVSNRKIFAGSELTASFGESYWREHKLAQLTAPKEEASDDSQALYEFQQMVRLDRAVFGEDIYNLYNEGQLSKVFIGTQVDQKILNLLGTKNSKTLIVRVSGKWIIDYNNIIGIKWY
jgi:hypothetical protein